MTRRRFVLGALASAAALFPAAGLTGCDATTVDVYVPVRVTERDADGTTASVTTYTLDESGNAVGTLVEQAGAAAARTTGYDAYGIPAGETGTADAATAADGAAAYEATPDDYGQPLELVARDADGVALWRRTFEYTQVKGRIAREGYTSGDLGVSYVVAYDSDGWPLEGTVEVDGPATPFLFVYEITETGRVTAQHLTVEGEPVATFTYEYDDEGRVSAKHADDGSSVSFEYELIGNPSPWAMVCALTRWADLAALVPYDKAVTGRPPTA